MEFRIGACENRGEVFVKKQPLSILAGCPSAFDVFGREADPVNRTTGKEEGHRLLHFDRLGVRRDAATPSTLCIKRVAIHDLGPKSGDDLQVAPAEPGFLTSFAACRRKLAFSRLEVPLGETPMTTVSMMEQ